MNLQRIEVHQLGRKLGNFMASEAEFRTLTNMPTFALWLSTHPLDGEINMELLVWLVLVDPDRDGHPEIEGITIIMPGWDDRQWDLIAQGFTLAIRYINRAVDHPSVQDNDDAAQAAARALKHVGDALDLANIRQFIQLHALPNEND